MKITTKLKTRIIVYFGVLLLLASFSTFAENRVVVIPLFGDDAKPLKNIITVSKANSNFTDPVKAVDSIKDASQNNPYLVVIGPGVYTIAQPLVMQEYVDIVGSGENVTKIKGTIRSSGVKESSIILGADNSTLSALTVENMGAGDVFYVGLYNHSASPTLSNVTIKTSGGTNNYGIYNENSSPRMIDVTVTALGGSIATFGIYNLFSSPTMTGVTSKASSGSGWIWGVYNENSSPTMTSVTVTGTGSGYGRNGVGNDFSFPSIRRCTIKGDDCSISSSSLPAVTISQSTLIGAVVGTKCVACDDGSGNALDENCQ